MYTDPEYSNTCACQHPTLMAPTAERITSSTPKPSQAWLHHQTHTATAPTCVCVPCICICPHPRHHQHAACRGCGPCTHTARMAGALAAARLRSAPPQVPFATRPAQRSIACCGPVAYPALGSMPLYQIIPSIKESRKEGFHGYAKKVPCTGLCHVSHPSWHHGMHACVHAWGNPLSCRESGDAMKTLHATWAQHKPATV